MIFSSIFADIDVVKIWLAIDKDNFGTDIRDSLGGRKKSIRRHYHFIARPDAESRKRDLDGVGAVCDRDAIRSTPMYSANSISNSRRVLARDKRRLTDDAHYGFIDLIPYR